VIRIVYFRCNLPPTTADALNHESGRIYTQVMVEQYRIYRKKGVWLSPKAQERLNDGYNANHPALLHSHSIDAAQQGFPKACKTTREARKAGLDTKYPYRRKRYRTTVWKNTGIRLKEGYLLLSLARGIEPLRVEPPDHLKARPAESFAEMRLVYNKASRHYEWHLVVDDGIVPEPVQTANVAGGDLGEVHPIALTDGKAACVVSCRQLRAQSQHTAKNLASLQSKQSQLQKGSRRWKRLQRRKRRFLEKQERRRDLEHKISHAVIQWCAEHQVQTLALGDVRDVADGKRLRKEQQQKIANWSHGDALLRRKPRSF
jgi:putative transposase